ncbi:MAG: trigger factor, partial [Alphaproteobacteria bacterium]|nr:trigger factor [Alphaproteobacteria bacterium]
MEITETQSSGLTREFKVVVAAKDIEEKLNLRLNEVQGMVNLPGFRPGKVPLALVKKRYGPSVMGEVLEQVVQDSSAQAMSERDVRPAMQPKIEITKFDEGADLEYTMKLEVLPEISPVDFSTIAVERETAEVAADEVEKALGRISEQQQQTNKVEEVRPVKTGDVVVIDFTGKLEGKADDRLNGEGARLALGSNSFIAGFEDQLVGAKVGETRTVKVTFPDEYGNAELVGKKAVFTVEMKELHEPVPVELNDEFAKNMGFDDLEAVKKAIREQMEGEYKQAARTKVKRRLLDKLSDAHSFEVPAGMLEAEYEAIVRQLTEAEGKDAHDHDHDHDHHDHDHDHDHDHHGHDHDHDHHGHDHGHDHAHHHAVDEKLSDEDKAEYKGIAERRVRLGLLLSEVGRLNNITVSDEEVQRAMFQEASRYPGQERQVVEYFRSNPQAQASLRAPLFEDKIIDFILEMAKVSEKKVTPDELFKPIEDG